MFAESGQEMADLSAAVPSAEFVAAWAAVGLAESVVDLAEAVDSADPVAVADLAEAVDSADLVVDLAAVAVVPAEK